MDTKSILQSLTFWSLLAMVASEVAKRYGVTVDQAGLVNDCISIAASGTALYGRFRATQPLHVIPPPAVP